MRYHTLCASLFHYFAFHKLRSGLALFALRSSIEIKICLSLKWDNPQQINVNADHTHYKIDIISV